MAKQKYLSPLNINIDSELKTKFQILCACEGVSMTDRISAYMKQEVKKNNIKIQTKKRS